MKLAPDHMQLIEYLFGAQDWTPLEIAEELGLSFRQVCEHIDKRCLQRTLFFIARFIPKATRANTYQAKTWAWGDEHCTRIGAAIEANWPI